MRNCIFIVDDSEDTRELFTATLEFEGFDVVSAKDGQEALEILRQRNDFSMMLLDLSMPGLTGLEVLQEMEKQGLGKDIPVMLVSAANNLESLEVPGNVVDTLKKPFFYPELLFKIKELHGVKPGAASKKKRHELWPRL